MDKSEPHYSVFRRYIPAWGTQIVTCVLLSVALSLVAAGPGDCSGDSDCGVNSLCLNQTCGCQGELNLHTNLKDCVNGSCKSPDCVSCVHGTCQRCVHFIDKSSRECLHTCTGKAEMIYSGDVQGSVCTQSDGADDLSDIIIGIVAGVSAGVLLCVILGLCLHFHLKRKRGQVNLQSRHINSEPMEMGHVRKIPVFENKGFIIHPEPPALNKTAYLEEVERMKPSAQMLLDLLNQIRKRVRAMEPTDARIPTYKGVIHQLCRVLVMLNKKDPGSSVPADGLSLLEWARQMLQDYVETRQSLEEGDLGEEASQRYPPATPETTSTSLPPSEQTPYPAFSAREDPPFNPVYASPVDSLERTSHHTTNTISRSSYPNNSQPHTFAKLPPRPGHYSSVPVPYTETVTPNGVSRVGRGVPVSSPTVPAEDSGGSGESHGVRSAYKQYPTTRPVISHNPSGPPVTNKGGNPEIYAPASSYSDYAQPKVSTFSGGVPRSLSSDTPSHCSSDSDDPMPDGLPFDLEDATEPVEV